jgi:hypothetical protein
VLVGLVPAAPVAPVSRCVVDDPRLVELSGLAVVDGGVWAMADGGRRVELHRLDPDTCAVVESRTATVDPYDAEDLAAGPDGSLWVGDTGDNEQRRATVAVIVVPPQRTPQLYRLTYPDGPHDAEALLVDARGVPTVVTKEVGAAGIYRPEAALRTPGPTPLVHVGDLVLPSSETVGGPIGGLGSRTVTGGALSADGRVVALRTYTDAWLFAVPDDGGIVAALRGTPVRVPLPDEPQGEAVAFTADGTLLSGSEARGGVQGRLRAVTGATALVAAAPDPDRSARAGEPAGGDAPAAAGSPLAEPPAAWRSAAVGAGVLVAVLGLLAAAMARHASRRR